MQHRPGSTAGRTQPGTAAGDSLARAAAPGRKPRRVLLVASGGGHWVQLLRMRAAWAHADAAYLTVQASYRLQVAGHRFYAVHDATRWSRLSLMLMVLQVAWVVLRERPDVIITTGAAPGLVALWVGKRLGAHTAWVDSIANVEEMSLSGRRAGGFADLQLTQWAHLQANDRPAHRGAVL